MKKERKGGTQMRIDKAANGPKERGSVALAIKQVGRMDRTRRMKRMIFT
jgi:hypothetical protein